MIYIARMGTDGPVKIGIAANPLERIAKIQRALPEKMIVIQLVKGGRAGETMLHKRFAHLRLLGEWFTYCDEMTHDFGDLSKLRVLVPGTQHIIDKFGEPESYPDSTARRIAMRFGGQAAAARAFGIGQTTVFSWLKAGHIPQKHWKTVKAAARQHVPPFELSADDFVDFEHEKWLAAQWELRLQARQSAAK